jgi:multidrug resistance efflux pump
VGNPVDITVDAYPHTPVDGIVTEIQAGTAGRFTIWPNPDTDPTNPQKVDQYVPLKICDHQQRRRCRDERDR